MHFPEELTIESFGSGYGGNALLGKKCHALRIASWQARTEGWLAEHMLIVGLQNPQGETHYVAAAFPSACGKTNLAMLIPPESLPGWKVCTVGDDIAWLHPGTDGRLWAINPESGYFGVAPGTNPKTNRNAYDMIRRDTLFTNVALTADNEPWWEGRKDSDAGDRLARPALRCRRTARRRIRIRASPSPPAQNPSYTRRAEDPQRRADLGADLRRPPARAGAAGVRGARLAARRAGRRLGRIRDHRRRDGRSRRRAPRPDGDEAVLRLQLRRLLRALAVRSARGCKQPPRIFHVNWFRQDAAGKFLWPGFGDNLRVLAWMLERCAGRAGARDTADRLPARRPPT